MSDRMIVSHLHGPVDVDTARAWRRALYSGLKTAPTGSRLRLLVDQRQYDPADLAAHHIVRFVVPDLLAAHGMHPALADAVGVSAVTVTAAPDRRIIACALVHHDEFKMTELNRLVGRPDQRFFSDFTAAWDWLQRDVRPRGRAARPVQACCTSPVEAAPSRPRISTHVLKEN